MVRAIYHILKFLLLLLLPFFLLIRGSVFIYNQFSLTPIISITIAALLCSLLLFIYFSFFYGKFTGKLGSFKRLKYRFTITFLFILGFVIHGLVFISGNNVKESGIKKEFLKLQPIMRLGVSTIILFDNKSVLTDASRAPEDYKSMGLKTNSSSLHYPQKDGFVYALDLRTKGRTELRNSLISLYFKAMGFRVLRHTGTADHLHISMKCKYRPGAR